MRKRMKDIDNSIEGEAEATALPPLRGELEGGFHTVGTLTKTHGVGGELNFAFTDDVWDRVDADHLFVVIDGLAVPFFIEEYRFRSDTTAIIKFEDIDDEPAARELVGCEVRLERALLPDDEEAAYSWSEFIGLTINDIGTITAVDDSTENVLFSVGTPDGREHLIPAAEEWIADIDWQKRHITMTIPDGLLEL